jgi:RNA polymerase sigma-70 factor (ECF subfamily)
MVEDITGLLHSHHDGDREAFDRLMPIVYGQLRDVARRQLRRVKPGQTMDTSGLVRETYLQLVEETGVDWRNREHFLAICALTMRRVLVDAARRRHSLKRNGGVASVTLDVDSMGDFDQYELVLAVDQALAQLGEFNPRLVRIVECRFFAGMTEEETARALCISLRAVQRDWLRARVWLQKALA